MKLHLHATAGNQIRAYSAGRVVVNDTTYTRSVLVLRDRIIDDLWPERAQELAVIHFQHLANLQPEVVLLGTGDRLLFPDAGVTAPLRDARIGLEVMDTPAACRTYNILAADGRMVAALLHMTAGDA